MRSGDYNPKQSDHPVDTTDPASAAWSSCILIPCADGKSRPAPPAKSSIRLLDDGFWYRMADVYAAVIEKASKGVIHYAKTTGARPSEILSLVQQDIHSEEIWEEAGRSWGIPAEKILLDFLRDISSACDKPTDKRSSSQETCSQTDSGYMRDLWVQINSDCPSYRPGPDEQQPFQSPVALRELSQFLACCCKACWDYHARTHAANFPLAPKITGRVGMLRALGNAIVPQVAAEFIRCYLET